MTVEFLPCGDCAFTVQFGDRVDRGLSRRVMALHAALREYDLHGIVETVPTFRSITIHYDPLETSQADLKALIEPLAANAETADGSGARVRLPVCYDPLVGLDLADVAAKTSLTQDEIVRLHSGTTHYVYMVGFAPGHPYIGDLPEPLVLPRREDPRPEVAAGTIAIAVGLTVVYPFANPCGWHVIGRTPVRMFDQHRLPPALVGAGDTIECCPISIAEFERVQAEVSAGCYQVDRKETS